MSRCTTENSRQASLAQLLLGPCKKHPGNSLAKISGICFGHSHRSTLGKRPLHEAIVRTKPILGLPEDYLVGIVPASYTGAMNNTQSTRSIPRPSASPTGSK